MMLEWTYVGVNTTVAGNGGPECANFLTWKTRSIETVVILVCMCFLIKWGLKNLSPLEVDCSKTCDPTGKRVLLVLMSLIWGIEIGFKFSSKTVIFLLNPCHITTALQIYLLASKPSKTVAVVFRFHLNCMNGAILALAFPELDALNLPFETWIYWIQHTMMLIIPLYLLHQGGVFETEKLSDLSWCAVSYGVIIIYHFVLLQALSIPVQVNLNHMLCPAVRDPFRGPHYRKAAVIHQAILCPLMCKTLCAISHVWYREDKEKSDYHKE
ncbi:transmembrane protein 164 [Lycorma delicatula]|uniref:transmembrane protein 164 n=1 Tax=Lycorma delicatula TaxID=130591 RepID=UPI003F51387C